MNNEGDTNLPFLYAFKFKTVKNKYYLLVFQKTYTSGNYPHLGEFVVLFSSSEEILYFLLMKVLSVITSVITPRVLRYF